MVGISSNLEILQIIEAVSKEKGLPRAQLIEAMELGIAAAGKGKFGSTHNIKAKISEKNGEVKLYRVLDIVDQVDDYSTQISFDEAKESDPEAEVGGKFHEILPPIDLGRIAAQTAKQIIIGKVNEAERQKQYEDFKDRVGELLSGTVKRIEFGNIIVDLGRAEAIIRRDQVIMGENFKIGDPIKAYVLDVRLESKGPQIFLSRTDNQIITRLFELEVPEVYDGIIQIKAIARDPGSKAKVAVFAADTNIDAVGSCVGIRGNRVKAITNELAGEKIDIVLWNKNVAQFVINAMAPAEISKIVIDEDKHKVEAVVQNEQLSLAIGRRGQNVRLASKLTNWNIDVMTVEQESKRRNDEFNNSTQLFKDNLGIDETAAQLLSVEGFTSIEQIAQANSDMIASIEGFDKILAENIQEAAINYVNQNNEIIIEKLEQLGVEQELLDILNLQPENILKLAEYGVKTIEDLAEISISEFKELIPQSNMNKEEIEYLLQFAKSQTK